jgi:hypothetical protein
MDSKAKLLTIIESAIRVTEKYLDVEEDDFRVELYSNILIQLKKMKVALKNDVLPKGLKMLGFIYIISDQPTMIPNEIAESAYEVSRFYREVYSK